MKKLFYLVCILMVSISYSQNTFRLWHFNAKDGTEEAIGNLLAEYNEEILKQSSTVLSDQEINQSKELANQLNNQLSEITSDIEVAESQSNAFQQKIQSLK